MSPGDSVRRMTVTSTAKKIRPGTIASGGRNGGVSARVIAQCPGQDEKKEVILVSTRDKE